MDTFLSIINEISKKNSRISAAGLVFGEVTSISPLKIKLDGSYEIGEEFIVLSGFCKETKIRIPQHNEYEHIHDEEESLGFLSGTGNLGNPVMFIMSGVPTFIKNPDYISSLDTPNEPPTITNPDFDPTTVVPTPSIKLTHKHVIKKALPEILLWRGLQVGDRVRMIRLGMGQIHYVFERLQGVTNDPK